MTEQQIGEPLGEAWEDYKDEPLPEPDFYTVCPFLVDRAYGGPEEGGWYYNTGQPETGRDLPTPIITRNVDVAYKVANEMQKVLDETVNKGRRSISSVLSEGVYAAEVCNGWPKPYPEVKPHYE